MFNVSNFKKLKELITDKSQEKPEKIRRIKQPYQEILTQVDRCPTNGPALGGTGLRDNILEIAKIFSRPLNS